MGSRTSKPVTRPSKPKIHTNCGKMAPSFDAALQRYVNGGDYLELFELCDREGRGKLNWEDFAEKACPALGVPADLDVYKFADRNLDGYVDYEEFGAMLSSGTCFGRPLTDISVDKSFVQPGLLPTAEVLSVEPPTGTALYNSAETQTITETCEQLRLELGLAEAPMNETLAAACQALGVPQGGTIKEQAERCRTALGL